MKYAQVRIVHVQDGRDVDGRLSRTAKIWLEGVEVEGIASYHIDGGPDYGKGGVIQKVTLEFFAEVEIEQVKR